MKLLLPIIIACAILANAAELTNTPPVSTTNEARLPETASNAVSSAASRTPGHSRDFAAFKIIPERNIFNPNRSARGSGTPRPDTGKAPRIDSFALLGTMIYEKGSFAFFDGSSSDYRKVLTTSNSIAGYLLKDIDPEGVKLEKDGKSLQLGVGQQMKRQNEGEWSVSDVTNDTQNTARSGSSSNSSTPSTSESSSSGSQSDVLKRLLEKREKELTK